MRYEQDHDFRNDSDKDKMILVEPGEVVRITSLVAAWTGQTTTVKSSAMK